MPFEDYAPYARELGYDPSEPEVRAQIEQLEAQFPGVPAQQVVQQLAQTAQSLGPQLQQAVANRAGASFDQGRYQQLVDNLSKLGAGARASAQADYDQRAAQAREGERWASALAPDTSASNRQVRDTELKQAATETLGKLEGQRRDAQQDLVTEAANVRFQQEQADRPALLAERDAKAKREQAESDQRLMTGAQQLELNQGKLDDLKAARASNAELSDPNSEISKFTRATVADTLKKLKMDVPGVERASAAQLQKLIPGLDKLMDNQFKLAELQLKHEDTQAKLAQAAAQRAATDQQRREHQLFIDQRAAASAAGNLQPKIKIAGEHVNELKNIEGVLNRLAELNPDFTVTAGNPALKAVGDALAIAGIGNAKEFDALAANVMGAIRKAITGPGGVSDKDMEIANLATALGRDQKEETRARALTRLSQLIKSNKELAQKVYENLNQQYTTLNDRANGAPSAAPGVVDFNSLK